MTMPLNQHDQPIAESDEKENMDEKPGKPGDEAEIWNFPKSATAGRVR